MYNGDEMFWDLLLRQLSSTNIQSRLAQFGKELQTLVNNQHDRDTLKFRLQDAQSYLRQLEQAISNAENAQKIN